MDDPYAPRPIAGWYLPAAIVALLLMLLYCAGLVMDVTVDPATLDPDQQALTAAEPAWVMGATFVAGMAGLVGSVLLVLRRRQAEPAMMLSLAAIIIWFAGVMISPMRDLLSSTDWVVVIVVVAIFWTIFWFARHSRQRGWLR
jgi:ABC-type Na+ efflux pump permease subunit